MKRFVCVAFVASLAVQSSSMNTVFAQAKKPVRGSIVEDRAAKKLIEAGDGRYEAEEYNKAVDVWESVLERYPRSRHIRVRRCCR